MSSTDEWPTRPGGLAAKLRDLRVAAGLTGAALADRLGWAPAGQPRVSKIENGRQLPTEEDIRAWVGATGESEATAIALLDLRIEAEARHRRWRQRVRGGQAALQAEYDARVRGASLVRNLETMVIPGLLQTPDYARSQAMQAVRLNGADPAEVDAVVVARMRRQDVLYDTAKRFEFLVAEAALRHLYCPPAAMRDQLDRLVATTYGRSNVWFGILPFGVELPLIATAGFVVLDDELAIVEGFVDEYEYRGELAAVLEKVMSTLAAEAWTGERARERIVRAMSELRGSESTL